MALCVVRCLCTVCLTVGQWLFSEVATYFQSFSYSFKVPKLCFEHEASQWEGTLFYLTYICKYVCVCTYKYIFTNTYVNIFMLIYLNISIYIYVYIYLIFQTEVGEVKRYCVQLVGRCQKGTVTSKTIL